MKKNIISLATIAFITGTLTLGTHASAEEVTVRQGDTLWGIAKEHHIEIENLKEWNGLTSTRIHPNDTLKVALTEKYVVEKGDTLTSIAAQFDGVTWNMLQNWNELGDSDLIYPGDTLLVYIEGEPTIERKHIEVQSAVQNVEKNEKQVEATEEVEVVSEENVETVEEVEVTEEPVEAVEKEQQEEPTAHTEQTNNDVSKEFTVTATAYTANCQGCSGITATGINLNNNPNKKVISVDPSVIPLGTEVYVEGYGHAIAGDTGGAIKGNKIDVFVPNNSDAINWGVREVNVQILN